MADNKDIAQIISKENAHSLCVDKEYALWLAELKSRYRNAQLKAAVKVNSEKLLFNWLLGAEIVLKKAEERWGAGIVERLSQDLQNEFPNADGFTSRNLWNMKQWYLFYSNPEHSQKLKQAVSQFETFQKTHPLVVEQVGYSVYPEEELKQAVSVFPKLFAYIGWSHHIAIMQKCKDMDEALFFRFGVIRESQG